MKRLLIQFVQCVCVWGRELVGFEMAKVFFFFFFFFFPFSFFPLLDVCMICRWFSFNSYPQNQDVSTRVG